MSGPTELRVSVDVDAPADLVWTAATDWAAQSEWMLGTRVSVDRDPSVDPAAGSVPDPEAGRRLGARLTAVTGVGPLGVRDRMEVVEWDPPRRAVVAHLGRVIRGRGVFEVIGLTAERSLFVWTELLELPLGALGRLGWPAVRPVMRLGVRRSLDRFAARCATAHAARTDG